MNESQRLSASIVLYKTKITDLLEVIKSYSPSTNKKLYIVDNSPEKTVMPKEILSNENIFYIFSGKNRGYGAGHNIAIKKAMESGSDYHVVLNPDLSFEPSIIDKLADYMKKDDSIGQLSPKIVNQNGELQYLCKLIPTPFDLIFKRFLPKKCFEKRSEKFQLKFTGYDKVMNVPYLSGCFMFFRTSALKDIGLFDERFFMYPEDIDITRRMHEKYKTLFIPSVQIIHAHAAESYKSKKMLKVHIKNMVKYFNKWGWFFDNKRRKVNRQVLKELGYGEK